jgi:hypothetical protein
LKSGGELASIMEDRLSCSRSLPRVRTVRVYEHSVLTFLSFKPGMPEIEMNGIVRHTMPNKDSKYARFGVSLVGFYLTRIAAPNK